MDEYSCRQREQQKEKVEQLRRSGNAGNAGYKIRKTKVLMWMNETEAKKALAAATEISHDLVCDFIQASL